MSCSRVLVAACVVATLAADVPVFAQGKKDDAHGGSSNNRGNGNNRGGGNGNGGPGNAATPASQGTPNQSVLIPTATVAGPAVTPFAWIDNARVMTAGTVWLGVSMMRWQGSGLSEASFPVIDGAVGLSSRLQLGVSVPRVIGSDLVGTPSGLGTSFLHTKIVLLQDADGLNVATSPTLEILSVAAANSATTNQSRTHWGLPVSVDVDRGRMRLYSSAGYFSPGVWFGGAGLGTLVKNRVGVSVSFSRSWSTTTDPTIASPQRNELSAGASMDLTPHIGVFASLGRTIATSAQNGAGTTMSIGMSLTASRPVAK
jgi:hypothetical protein